MRHGDFVVVLSEPDRVEQRSNFKGCTHFPSYEEACREADRRNREMNDLQGVPKRSPFPFWFVTSKQTLPDRVGDLLNASRSRFHEEN